MSVESSRFACASPLLGTNEGAGIELITARVDSVGRDRRNEMKGGREIRLGGSPCHSRSLGPALNGEPSSSLQGPGLSTHPHHNFGVHYALRHSAALGVGTLLEIRVGVLGDKSCHRSSPGESHQPRVSTKLITQSGVIEPRRRERAYAPAMMYTWTKGDKYCHPMCASCQNFPAATVTGWGLCRIQRQASLLISRPWPQGVMSA
jgi:hypothetical protein